LPPAASRWSQTNWPTTRRCSGRAQFRPPRGCSAVAPPAAGSERDLKTVSAGDILAQCATPGGSRCPRPTAPPPRWRSSCAQTLWRGAGWRLTSRLSRALSQSRRRPARPTPGPAPTSIVTPSAWCPRLHSGRQRSWRPRSTRAASPQSLPPPAASQARLRPPAASRGCARSWRRAPNAPAARCRLPSAAYGLTAQYWRSPSAFAAPSPCSQSQVHAARLSHGDPAAAARTPCGRGRARRRGLKVHLAHVQEERQEQRHRH
jgi:hypothetical protein